VRGPLRCAPITPIEERLHSKVHNHWNTPTTAAEQTAAADADEAALVEVAGGQVISQSQEEVIIMDIDHLSSAKHASSRSLNGILAESARPQGMVTVQSQAELQVAPEHSGDEGRVPSKESESKQARDKSNGSVLEPSNGSDIEIFFHSGGKDSDAVSSVTGDKASLAAEERLHDIEYQNSYGMPTRAFRERWLIDPRATWYRYWLHLSSCLVVFSTFFTPYRYGFIGEDNDLVVVIDGAIDAFFGVDILMRFNTAVQQSSTMIYDRRLIAIDYIMSAAFWIDILATVPIDMLWIELALVNDISKQSIDQVAAALSLLRLLRINRILIFCRALQQNTKLNLLGVVIGKFLLFILLCTHISGCIFYGLARVNDFKTDTWIGANFQDLPDANRGAQYVHALFWAVGTFKAGPVSGKLGPVSISEMILASMAMLVNICLQTYLVSSMAALLTSADVNIFAFRNRLRQLSAYAERKKLPANVRDQIAAYLRFRYVTNEDLENTVLGLLPELFRQRVSHALYENLVENLVMFSRPKKCNVSFLWQVHGALIPTSYMPHHDFVNQEEPAAKLHILADGEVLLLKNEDIIEYRFKGDELTAVPFICKITQPFGVRTTRTCSVLSIDHSSWEAVTAAQPEDNARVNANLLRHCERRLAQCPQGGVAFDCYRIMCGAVRRHLLHYQQGIVSTLCYAAARGDLPEIHKYLVGQTADCADYDARSPLHIAAANGQAQAIELLIRKNGNVNAVDNFGRTPLLEACRSRQMGAARELVRHGGSLGFTEAIQMSQQLTRLSRSESKPSPSVLLTYTQILKAEASELCGAAADPQQLWYLKALVEFGADVNACDYDARCALHVAAASGNKAAVEFMLRQDAVDVDVRDNFGRTPLMEAVRHNQEPCARLLKAHNAKHGMVENTAVEDEEEVNAIHAGQELCQAAFSNQRAYLSALVEFAGVDVDTPDYDLRTALMLACAEGNSEVAVELVHHGADIQRKDRWGHTPLSEAVTHGHHDLAKLLESMQKIRSDLAI